MSIPSRLKDESPGTFFVTANAFQQKHLLQSDRSANLFITVMFEYRDARKLLVHEFAVMPNHVHILLTPLASKVSDSMRLIKGGFSFRAGKELGGKGELWQRGFSEHCVRNADDYDAHKNYIWQNAVKARFVDQAEDWPWCSANGKHRLDEAPEHLRS